MARKANKKLSELLLAPKWCEYAEQGLTPKYVVHRFDDKKGNRFYFFLYGNEVVIASGVTSAFGMVSTERDAIERWKEKHSNWKQLLDASADYGTQLHLIFLGIALKKGVNKTLLESMRKIATEHGQSADMPVKDTLALMKFQEDFNLVPLLVEAQLVYQDPETGEWLCLTIDILAKMTVTEVVKTMVQDGVYQRGEKKGLPKMVEKRTEVKRDRIMLGDLKSNFFEKEDKSYYEGHKMQLILGAKAVEQNFGIRADGCFNFSPKAWRTNPDYTYYEHDVTVDDLNTFDAYWKLIVAKKINVPKGSILITDNFKDSSDFKMLSYKEYAEQQLLPQPIVP